MASFERAYVEAIIAKAKREGLKMVVPPAVSAAGQREGLWEPDAMIVSQPIKGAGE